VTRVAYSGDVVPIAPFCLRKGSSLNAPRFDLDHGQHEEVGFRSLRVEEERIRGKQMARKYIPLFCLAGLLAPPASLALACHIEISSVELSCTQYRITVTAIGVPSTYSIRYTLSLASTAAEPPLTISNTIPITAQSGDFTEIVTNPLSLTGVYDAKSLSGSASLISNTGQTENTIRITFSPKTLNCSPPAITPMGS
jgi:hypothetical protein